MFVYNDGGRLESGFTGRAGDCVTRAIAIAAELDYREVYDALYDGIRTLPTSVTRKKRQSPRKGVPREVYDPYLAQLGWVWTPTMKVGTGCRVHLRSDELPSGRIIVRLTKHLCAIVDGDIHDTYDPSREGTRCVYGYWQTG